MERRKFLTAGAASVAAVGLATTAGRHAQAAETWQIQSLWQAGSINQKVVERFAQNVNAMTGGRLTLEALPVGAVVSHIESLDAVSSGILASQQSATVYFTGRDPAFGLMGDLNAAYENPYQMTMWFYKGGGLELARELYKSYGLYYVGPVFWGVESIPMRIKISSLDDFKGVKLRMPEGPSAEIFRKLGAAPVNLPGAEVYTSLERGVIDGADWGTLSMNQDLGFHKIAKYPIYPGVHSMPAGDVAFNLDKWNALEPDLQAILETATKSLNLDMIQTMAMADLEARKALEGSGVELVALSGADRHRLRQVASEVWADFAKRSPMAEKVYQSQTAFLKKLGLL